MCAIDEEEQDTLLTAEDGNGSPSKKGHRVKQQSDVQRCVYLIGLFSVCAFIAGFLLRITSNIVTSNDDTGYVPLLNKVDIRSSSAEDDDSEEHNNMREIIITPLFNETYTTYLQEGMQAILDQNKAEGKPKKRYPMDSPFELRFPGDDQPYWAKRTIPWNRNVGRDKQICFVHVGKAGGSTLGCLLGFSLHCDTDNDIKGLLPIVTTHAFHRGVNDCYDDAGYYLFVVRDPLARMLSDYNYERPNITEAKPFRKSWNEHELYIDCKFWTLEDLVQKGLLNEKHDDFTEHCREAARETIAGDGRRMLAHSYFNYQYYSQFVFKTEDDLDGPTIPENVNNMFVIRNNYMVEDWNTINIILGGEPEVLKLEDIPHDNAHAKNASNLFLSDSSKVVLCDLLCNEIQVYKEIIKKAVNFNDNDIKQTMKELLETCPKEASADACSVERPDFSEKVKQRRGELEG